MIDCYKKRSLKKIGCLSVLLLACLSCSPYPQESSNQVCFKQHCVNVKIASSSHQLRKGLQFRDSLDLDAGMLFIFPKTGIHKFWMKDTKIPLDIIWLNENKEVIYIASDVPPCLLDPCPTYGTSQYSSYVLEINAGHIAKLGIKKGERAVFRLNERLF